MAGNSEQITDRMAYIVVLNHSGGAYLPERNVSELDRKSVVKDIADAQLEDVLQVIEFNPAERTSRDVTEDIMNEVIELWADDAEPVSDWQFNIIEQTRGFEAANSFARAA